MLQQVVAGDLVLAGSSTRPGPDGTAVSDVDGDTTRQCIRRNLWFGLVCADNSSSATVDLPFGAEVIRARLYVSTTLAPSAGPLSIRVIGPGDDGDYRSLGVASPSAPRIGEQADGAHRQAAWDVTDLVRTGGGGQYTVADIVSEATSGRAEYSAWSIVVAYQLTPGIDVTTLPPELQTRFARRALSWHDGLASTAVAAAADGRVDIEVGGFTVPMDRPVVAKSLHVLAPAATGFENVLFDGQPLGNNSTPGDAVAPAGMTIGADPACNSTVDPINGSICTTGTSAVRVAAAVPTDPPPPVTSPVSAVDMDVVRIPDRYVRPGATTAVVSVVSEQDVAVAVVAVSIDQPLIDQPVTP